MFRLKTLFFDLLSVFFPYRCHVCKSCCEFGTVLCDDCKQKLTKAIHKPEKVNDTSCNFSIFTMSSYDDFPSEIIKIVKYRPSKRLAKILGNICAEKANLKSFLKKEDVVIPIPMHEKRLEERGFNQASILAESYSNYVGCYFSPAVVRSRFTKPQASCNEKERFSNLENAFILSPDLEKSAFKGKRLIVIDDVATTGTTLKKCIEPLKTLEAKEIIALVVSHSYKKF